MSLAAPAGGLRRLGVMAFTSTHTRRLYPARLSLPLINAHAAASRRARTRRWRENVSFYRELLRYTSLAGAEEEVATRAVAEYFRASEIFWRPWLMGRGEIEGLEHLEAARARGRGVVAPFPHFGLPYAQFPIMHRYHVDAWVIAAPQHYMELHDDWFGRSNRQGRKYIDLLGEGRAIVRWPTDSPTGDETFGRSLRVLEEGGIVSVAFDSVGSLSTPFMGRNIKLAGGAALLACASGAIVAPFVHRFRGCRPVIRFAPALDPEDFVGAEALQAALAAIMEEWALERPYSVWALETQPGGPPLINGPPRPSPVTRAKRLSQNSASKSAAGPRPAGESGRGATWIGSAGGSRRTVGESRRSS